MNELDENISLLFGDPIVFCEHFIYPLTIREIKKFKFSDFYSILYLLMSDETDLEVVSDEHVREFDILFSNIIYNPDKLFSEKILFALSLMFKEEIGICESGIIVGDNFLLNADNYIRFVEIIKRQYCLKKEVKLASKNSKQDEYFKQLAKMRKKYENFIKTEDISDWISSVIAKHNNLDFIIIQDLTIYQLINQFKRLNKIDDYFVSIEQLLAGASSDEVKVIHWSKRLSD